MLRFRHFSLSACLVALLLAGPVHAQTEEALREQIEAFRAQTQEAVAAQQEVFRATSERRVFENNLLYFHEKYIETENAQWKGDPATTRYFVEYRLNPYLQKYGDFERAKQVREWKATLEKRYDAADPFPGEFWDVEVISAFESQMEHHGTAWRVLADWKAKNPESPHLGEIEDKLDMERRRAERFLEYIAVRVDSALGRDRYVAALGHAVKGCHNLQGIDELTRKCYERGLEIAQLARDVGVEVDLSALAPFAPKKDSEKDGDKSLR